MTDLKKDQEPALREEELDTFRERVSRAVEEHEEGCDDCDTNRWSTGITLGRFHMSTGALFVILAAAYFILCAVLNRNP